MSKKKLKSKYRLTRTDTQRVILRDGEKVKLSNDSGMELLVTIFPSVHHDT